MEFRLMFEGEIKPRQRASLADIHAIRQSLHPQMKTLWNFPPLSSQTSWLQRPEEGGDYAILEEVGSRTYAPLISKRADLIGELDIIFLRQQAPGQLISEGGDIDNRIKTLFDAFRMPSKSEVNSLGSSTDDDPDPLYCLLQDDSLITKVTIETDRLLRPVTGRELVAIIKVKVRATRVTFGTINLMG
jgi:hypothetical protein